MVFYEIWMEDVSRPTTDTFKVCWLMKQHFQDRGSAAVSQFEQRLCPLSSGPGFKSDLCHPPRVSLIPFPVFSLLSCLVKPQKKGPETTNNKHREKCFFWRFCLYLRESSMDLNVTNLVYFGGWYL